MNELKLDQQPAFAKSPLCGPIGMVFNTDRWVLLSDHIVFTEVMVTR